VFSFHCAYIFVHYGNRNSIASYSCWTMTGITVYIVDISELYLYAVFIKLLI